MVHAADAAVIEEVLDAGREDVADKLARLAEVCLLGPVAEVVVAVKGIAVVQVVDDRLVHTKAAKVDVGAGLDTLTAPGHQVATREDEVAEAETEAAEVFEVVVDGEEDEEEGLLMTRAVPTFTPLDKR